MRDHAEIERRTLAAAGLGGGEPPATESVQPPSGGGSRVTMVYVVAIHEEGERLIVRAMGGDGQPAGDPFTIATWRYPSSARLEECVPAVVGERVPVVSAGGVPTCALTFIWACSPVGGTP